MISLLWNLLTILKMVCFKLPNSKKLPNSRDIEVMDLFLREAMALAYIDNMKQFQVTVLMIILSAKFDLSKIPNVSGCSCSYYST